MKFPLLNNYLARLSEAGELVGSAPQAGTSIRLDHAGRAQGRFFNCTLTSAFQPLRGLDTDTIVGYEGVAHSASANGLGLSVSKLFGHSASDDASVELDRLCRMLHAINFFRQAQDDHGRLYLSVHERLLGAVSSNHGQAFRRVLDEFSLPFERIVLQLPPVTPNQRWMLDYVADNYRGNGFAVAVDTAGTAQAVELLTRLTPQAIRVDARHLGDDAALTALLSNAADVGVQIIFSRIETATSLQMLLRAGARAGRPVVGQGLLLDQPGVSLLDAGPSPEHADHRVLMDSVDIS
jgi:EAL domain-containing protein (putative c-di-GMP-specific phosphodiesterase class I)